LIGARASQNIGVIKAKKNPHVFTREVEVNQEHLNSLAFCAFLLQNTPFDVLWDKS
jgi:hypothetical protein